jgi:uncharacterized protein GlcG (DUF336 family)
VHSSVHRHAGRIRCRRIAFPPRSRSKRRARQLRPALGKVITKLRSCSTPTVPPLLRGDGAGIHTLDSAHDKAYTSVSFKNDTLASAERAKGEDSIAPLAKLPHIMFFGGGVVIKLGDEVIGSIGAAGAPGAKLDDGCAHAGLDKIRERLKWRSGHPLPKLGEFPTLRSAD